MSGKDENRAELLRESLGRAITEVWQEVYADPAQYFPELLATCRSKKEKDVLVDKIRHHLGRIGENCVEEISVRLPPIPMFFVF